MNDIQRYLAEEIALDCGHGYITRSEAFRRLKVMGVSAAVALSMLAACGADDRTPADTAQPSGSGDMSPDTATLENMPAAPEADGNAAAPAASGGTNEGNVIPAAPAGGLDPAAPPAAPSASADPAAPTPPANPAAMSPADVAALTGPGMGLPTQPITFNGPNGLLEAAFAAPAQPRGAVLVIHENRGLNDHIRTVVGRLAAAGYAAIGLDLLSEEGGTASLGDTANATAALGRVPADRFVSDMRAALDELQLRAPGAKLGAIGFCFGGGMMWQLLAADPRLASVTPFYGQWTGGDLSNSSAAVLAFYGELDNRITSTRDAADQALTDAGLTHQMVTFAGANHAFFNDTGMAYNADAAAQAWVQLLTWFSDKLG
jgi:carboxymethylenebutenolidase